MKIYKIFNNYFFILIFFYFFPIKYSMQFCANLNSSKVNNLLIRDMFGASILSISWQVIFLVFNAHDTDEKRKKKNARVH